MVWCFMEIPQGPRQQAKTTGHRVLDSPVVPFIHTTSVAGSQQQRHFPSTPSTMALSIVVLIRLWFNFNMIIYAKKNIPSVFSQKVLNLLFLLLPRNARRALTSSKMIGCGVRHQPCLCVSAPQPVNLLCWENGTSTVEN